MLKNEMDSLLAKGGMKDEAGEVEEETGNEVPAGSLKEEVADTVDAKLSVGEFVIPADVVRYIGLEKLMKMRDAAKEGLARMEEIGQVGNADEVDNADALHSAKAESEDEGGDNNYASGGYVGGTANAEKYKRAPIKGFEMVQMTDDKGNTIYIPYVNGKPQLQVPVGYKPVVNAATTPQAAAPTTTPTAPATPAYVEPVRGGGGAKNGPSTPAGGEGGLGSIGSGTGYSVDKNNVATPNASISPKVASTIGGMVFGPLGAIVGGIGASVVGQGDQWGADQHNAQVAVGNERMDKVYSPEQDQADQDALSNASKPVADAAVEGINAAVAEGLTTQQAESVSDAAAAAAANNKDVKAAISAAIAAAKDANSVDRATMGSMSSRNPMGETGGGIAANPMGRDPSQRNAPEGFGGGGANSGGTRAGGYGGVGHDPGEG
jgi:hypothetical protein